MFSHYDKIIKNAYKNLLLREADIVGYNHHMNLLRCGKINESQLIDLIKNSDEYKKLQNDKQVINYDKKNLLNLKIESIVKKHDWLQNFKIKYIGHIGHTGYCDWIKNLVYALVEFGAEIQFEIITKDDDTYVDTSINTNSILLKHYLLYELSNKNFDNYDIVIIHTLPDFWKTYCEKERKKNKNVKIYGVTVWECDVIPKEWTQIINSCIDYLIVPSEWNKEVFSKSITVPINVIYHIIKEPDNLLFAKSIINVRDDCYVFYAIAQWHARKRLDSLIRDFLETFTHKDNVALFIKTSPYDKKYKNILEKHINNIIKEYPNPATVIYNLEHITENDIYMIHKRGNCYISPFTDGLGFGSLMAASMGKRIITTDYGGQREYLKDVDFIKCTLTSVKICDYEPYDHTKCKSLGYCIYHQQYDPKTQKWANPDKNHTRELMKKVYNERFENDNRQLITKEFITKTFSTENIINRLIVAFNM